VAEGGTWYTHPFCTSASKLRACNFFTFWLQFQLCVIKHEYKTKKIIIIKIHNAWSLCLKLSLQTKKIALLCLFSWDSFYQWNQLVTKRTTKILPWHKWTDSATKATLQSHTNDDDPPSSSSSSWSLISSIVIMSTRSLFSPSPYGKTPQQIYNNNNNRVHTLHTLCPLAFSIWVLIIWFVYYLSP